MRSDEISPVAPLYFAGHRFQIDEKLQANCVYDARGACINYRVAAHWMGVDWKTREQQ